MGSPVEIKDKIKQEGKILDKWFGKYLLILSISLFLLLVGLAVCYTWEFPFFKFSESINAERWGQFGDFYGGVIGTFITFISIIFLYKAFKEQRLANVQTEETNAELFKLNTKQLYNENLQQYDNHFNRLFNLYQNALLNYNDDNSQKNGKNCLGDKIQAHLSDIDIQHQANYRKRVTDSAKLFNKFIHIHRSEFNTHIHSLYQILRLLESNVIDEEDRIIYAKTLRSQLTDKELILIRYNCLYEKGEKMKLPVFHYNLLKHLPIINLLEFNEYRKILTIQEVNILNDEIIEWRKQISNLFKGSNFGKKKEFKRVYSNYSLSISVDDKNNNYIFKLKKSNSREQDDCDIEKVLNKFSNDMLENLLLDINMEILNYSDFRIFSRNNKFFHRCYNNDEITIFTIIVKNKYPIIVSYLQVKNPS